jgi:hypothetical protein
MKLFHDSRTFSFRMTATAGKDHRPLRIAVKQSTTPKPATRGVNDSSPTIGTTRLTAAINPNDLSRILGWYPEINPIPRASQSVSQLQRTGYSHGARLDDWPMPLAHLNNSERTPVA